MPDRQKFDQNNRGSLIVVSNDGQRNPVELWADPNTHALTIAGTFSATAAKSATSTQSTATASTTTGAVLAANANRLGATIYNEGAAIAYVALAATASTTAYTLQIAVSGYYEVPYAYTGAISAITSTGTATLRVTEET